MTPARLFDTVVSHPATVVEASAGTGKTYQLEHLVVDLIAEGRATIDQLLVVTFTERATNELLSRVRTTLEDAAASPSSTQAPGRDESARLRLAEARRGFDQACITTIHGFCQRLLMDEPLATGRLLGQTQVDARAAFGEVFRDVLRRTFTTDARYRPYLNAHLESGRSVDALEGLLFRAATARGLWAAPFDEQALTANVVELAAAAVTFNPVDAAWKSIVGHPSSVKSFVTRTSALLRAAAAVRASHDLPMFLAALDREATEKYLEYVQRLTDAASPSVAIQALRSIL